MLSCAAVRKCIVQGVFAGACLMAAHVARAQDLAVIESTPQDRASADKLSELLHEPVQRLMAASPEPAGDAPRCQSAARRELVLDSAHHVVKLVRCRDGTALSRALQPEEAARTPYLGAFIAAELLAIDRELEAVETQQGAPQPEAATPPSAAPVVAAPAAAASAAVTKEAQPAAERAAGPVTLRIRAGADLAAWGAPFPFSVRPSLGLGLALQPTAASPQLVLELYASAFGRGQETRGAERLTLTRSDALLRAGALYPLWGGRFALGGFGFLRGSLTGAEYTGPSATSNIPQVRWGLGAGLEADLTLYGGLGLYAQALVDLATSRSDYLVAGTHWLKDPAGLLWIGAGLLLRVSP